MAKKSAEKLGVAMKKLTKFLGWMIPVVALIVAIIFLIQGRPNPTYTQQPDLLMPEYIKTILVFLPPATQLPTQADFTNLLSYFASDDRDWARKNLDALAWLGMGRDDTQYRDADDQQKMQAAYKFIIAQGPVQPLTIQKTIVSADKDHVTLQAASVRARWEIELVMQSGRWRILGLWGIRSKFATGISQFESKFASK